ncbi:MAG: ubiquinone/menaquinone biosynthesis methyltransferase [Thermoanaerobaculia bacterium]|nr:ubiquinone/menaquinone biosynthesis methyltransferase [Thermoanaerobaculia bacterium]
MAEVPTPEDKSARKVREMFGAVAPVYDRLNHLLSLSLDRLWRRAAARSLRGTEGPVLDLCCGTGDQAVRLRREGFSVTAVDFCFPMLVLARSKFRSERAELAGGRPRPLSGDALTMPFRNRTFSGIAVSFGIRNFADLDRGLREMARVLAPGGRVVILEFALPRARLVRWLYLFYFRRVLPCIGGWISRHEGAYDYLPSSVLTFPQREELTRRLEAAGFRETEWRDLSWGTVCLYTARRER